MIHLTITNRPPADSISAEPSGCRCSKYESATVEYAFHAKSG
jgi:hypothetical protein